MSGKQPRTILTDQSAAMAKAITEVFPKSNHRLCVWHIYQNAAKNLHHVFHSSKQFAKDFSDCLYEYEDEDEGLFHGIICLRNMVLLIINGCIAYLM